MMKKIWELEKQQKVCAIDLDGVIVNYPKCWIDFVNKKLKTKYKNLYELKNNLTFAEYQKLKIDYRTSGFKRALPLKNGAKNLINELFNKKYTIIILTSRPYRKHREIWKDTIFWLKKNGFLDKISGIIWEKEKHWAVLKEFPYLEFMIEDNAEIANQVAKLGYKVFVVDNEYNQQKLENNCERIFNLKEINKKIILGEKK